MSPAVAVGTNFHMWHNSKIFPVFLTGDGEDLGYYLQVGFPYRQAVQCS